MRRSPIRSRTPHPRRATACQRRLGPAPRRPLPPASPPARRRSGWRRRGSAHQVVRPVDRVDDPARHALRRQSIRAPRPRCRGLGRRRRSASAAAPRSPCPTWVTSVASALVSTVSPVPGGARAIASVSSSSCSAKSRRSRSVRRWAGWAGTPRRIRLGTHDGHDIGDDRGCQDRAAEHAAKPVGAPLPACDAPHRAANSVNTASGRTSRERSGPASAR